MPACFYSDLHLGLVSVALCVWYAQHSKTEIAHCICVTAIFTSAILDPVTSSDSKLSRLCQLPATNISVKDVDVAWVSQLTSDRLSAIELVRLRVKMLCDCVTLIRCV